MLSKLSSRKFWVTLATMLGVVGADQLLALPLPVLILMGVCGSVYVLGQSLVDALAKPASIEVGTSPIQELLAHAPQLLEFVGQVRGAVRDTSPDEETVTRAVNTLTNRASMLASAAKLDPNVLAFVLDVLRLILPFLFKRRA